jgi:YVTN family beta-propeller protein
MISGSFIVFSPLARFTGGIRLQSDVEGIRTDMYMYSGVQLFVLRLQVFVLGIKAAPSGEYCLFGTLRYMVMHQPVGKRLRRDNIAGIAVLTISLAAAFSTIGCGNQYRPVVSAIGPVGPPGQPTKYAVAVSSPSPISLGLLTIVDFSGDTVLSTPQILADPSYFSLNPNGTQGYTINAQGSLDTFPISPFLITSEVVQTTLPVGSIPVSITALTPASALSTIFIPETTGPSGPSVLALNAGTAALYDTVAIGASGSNPVYVVGAAGTPRIYAISQNTTGSNGQIDSIETVSTTSLSDSATIPVGIKPIYGVMTPDDRRAFILNEGSDTVSVINVPNNALDTLPGTGLSTITVGLNPVWADLSPINSELVVLNQGDGVHPGTLSIINIPLCNADAQATNPNCSPTNPVDAVGFGTILATATVGINPTMVSVLQGVDGTAPAAYVINQGLSTDTGLCAGEGSVSVVNLLTGQISATICGVSGATATADVASNPNLIFGHPNSVSATTGSPAGKVYVTSSDDKYMSVIYTDTNTVQTHIPLQGLGVRVLVTAP